jgi:Leucine-rich repeat (LRR) protein
MKTLKILLIFILSIKFSLNQEISCEYEDTTDFGDEVKQKTYSCKLFINNPDGFDHFERIPGKIDDEVNAIERSSGVTTIIPSILCDQFKNLIILSLSERGIEKLTENPLKNCKILGALYLSKNKIKEIHGNVFAENFELRFLDLSENGIKKLPTGIFQHQSKLEWLTLEDNEFEELQADIFKPLTGLAYFYLSGCGIKEVKSEWFESTKKLYYLDLSRNEIEELPRGKKLRLKILLTLS